MKDVLEVCCLPYLPLPHVFMDGQPQQLIREPRRTLPAEPGQPVGIDYQYARDAMANLSLPAEPLGGERRVSITE